jgi:hypothetical protein
MNALLGGYSWMLFRVAFHEHFSGIYSTYQFWKLVQEGCCARLVGEAVLGGYSGSCSGEAF